MNSKIARKLLCASATLIIGTCAVTGTSFAQDADAQAEVYAATLKQISDMKLSIAQKEVYIAGQNEKIARLQNDIETLPAKKEAIRPIVRNMVAEIEKQINQDLPFRSTERFSRLDNLREKLEDETVGESELFRLAMSLYSAEVGYGNTMGSYTGDNPINPGGRYAACEQDIESSRCALTKELKGAMEGGATLEDIQSSLRDGNYLHVGRLSLAYLELDSSEGYLYNKDAKTWEEVSGGDIIDLRKAVRISRGESAPRAVTAPVRVDASVGN